MQSTLPLVARIFGGKCIKKLSSCVVVIYLFVAVPTLPCVAV